MVHHHLFVVTNLRQLFSHSKGMWKYSLNQAWHKTETSTCIFNSFTQAHILTTWYFDASTYFKQMYTYFNQDGLNMLFRKVCLKSNTNHYVMIQTPRSVWGLSPHRQADIHSTCNRHSSHQIKICEQIIMVMQSVYEPPLSNRGNQTRQ